MGLLHRAEGGFDIEKAQPRSLAALRFHPVGVADPASQHLKSAADPDDPAAGPMEVEDRLIESAPAQLGQIPQGTLGAGQHEQIQAGDRFRILEIDQLDAGLPLEGIEIGIVGNARQTHHADAQRVAGHPAALAGQRHRVFFGKLQLQPGDHAQHRHPGAVLHRLDSRAQQRRIAAELVDDHPGHLAALGGIEHRQGADDRGEHAAAVDVRHQQHRGPGHGGCPQVGDVVGPEVDFRDAPRPLQNHYLVGRCQPVEGFTHPGKGFALETVILGDAHVAHRPPLDDDLGAGFGVGLEQDRIHVGVGGDAAGRGLQGLGPADLAPFRGNRRVERHVLRLERRHRKSAPPDQAAEPGGQNAFADIAAGPADKQRFGFPYLRGAAGRGLGAAQILLHIPSGRQHPAVPNPGVAVADQHQREHVDLFFAVAQGPQIGQPDRLPGPAGIAHDPHRRGRAAVPQQDLPGFADLGGASAAAGIVEGDHEIGQTGRIQAAADEGPGGHQIGKGDHRKIMHQRRAEPGCRGLDRGNAGHDLHLDRAVLAQLERQAGHAVDAGVARRDQGDAPPRGGDFQRLAAAVDLLLHPRRNHLPPFQQRFDQFQVGLVADHHFGRLDGGPGGRGQMAGIAGSEADDIECTFHGQLRKELKGEAEHPTGQC